MAIITERYLNLAVKTFDDAEKYIEIEPAKDVATQAVSALTNIKDAITDFAIENQEGIKELYEMVTSEMGSKQNYEMQNTEFAESSFEDYIAKVVSIPEAAIKGTISEDICLNSGFFKRDRSFLLALFSTEENEPVTISAEDAFDELRFIQELIVMTESFSKQLVDKAAIVPAKMDVMDGVYAKKYDTCLMAIRLMATSMVRFAALMLRHVVNNASMLYAHATDTTPRYARTEIPAIYWRDKDKSSNDDESNRWSIFV